MAENTKIEWTDHTFNPWEGCQKVGPGCDNCYAETRNARFAGGQAVNWGPGAPRRMTGASNWNKPLKWNKQAELQNSAWEGIKKTHPDLTDDELIAEGFFKPRRPRVFCASLADVFDNAVNPSWRADLFGLILKTPHLDWLLLTKRIGNVKAMLAELAHGSDPDLSLLDMMPLPNVWIGATVVNQEEADRDIPKLLAVPARVRFLSMEPLLGPVDLTGEWLTAKLGAYPFKGLASEHRTRLVDLLDWVIVGGESGPGARPMHPDWARSLRDQCRAAGVPFLFKQWGEWAQAAELPVHPEATRLPGNLCRVTRDGVTADHYVAISTDGGRKRYELRHVGKKAAGRLLDGSTWDGFPAL